MTDVKLNLQHEKQALRKALMAEEISHLNGLKNKLQISKADWENLDLTRNQSFPKLGREEVWEADFLKG